LSVVSGLAIDATEGLSWVGGVQITTRRDGIARISQGERIRLPVVASHEIHKVIEVLHLALISGEDLSSWALRVAHLITVLLVHCWVARDVVDEIVEGNVVRRPVTVFNEVLSLILTDDPSRDLLSNPESVGLKGLTWSDKLVINNNPLVVISARVVETEVADPFSTGGGQVIGNHDSDPIGKSLDSRVVVVERLVEDIVGSFHDNQVGAGNEEVISRGNETGL